MSLKMRLKKLFGKPRFKNAEIMHNVFIDGKSNIGEYTYIGPNTAITKATIGRYCSIGADVIIGPGEHLLTEISTSAIFYDNPYSVLTHRNVIIGNDVWIGTRAIVLRGVTIGDGAVIAAGAIVTKSVAPYSVVLGIPARVHKLRFEPNVISALIASAWWNYDPLRAKEIQERLVKELNIEKS